MAVETQVADDGDTATSRCSSMLALMRVVYPGASDSRSIARDV